MHLSLQDRWTALMSASLAGHMECVKVLLDKGAEANIQDTVSGLIIHCMQCSLYPESPVVNEDVYRTLFCTYSVHVHAMLFND